LIVDEWLTTPEAAKILNVTRQRVHQLIQSGALPGIKRGDRWFVRQTDLDRYRRLPEGKAGAPRKLKRRRR
jgi:excisionase family DNA binding protein